MMIQLSLLEVPTGACEPSDPARKHFRTPNEPNIQDLVVPNWMEDRQLRWLIFNGQTLEEAYRSAWLKDILPPVALRPCILDALKTQIYDEAELRWRPAYPGNFTCEQYFRCYMEYVRGGRESPPSKSGRMKIDDSITAPSPDEDHCIRGKLTARAAANLQEAYLMCGAIDIYPAAITSTGIRKIEDSIFANPKKLLYYALRNASIFRSPEEDNGVTHHHAPPEDEESSKWAWIVGAVIGVALLSDL